MVAMKLLRGEKESSLMPSGIKSTSCTILSWVCSSLAMDRDRGFGGECLGCCGKIGVDLDLCKSQGRKENVDLVFQSKFSI